MSSTKINHEGILLLEQPFIRVPYENFRKNFRTTQKYIEKELGAVQTMSRDLPKKAEDRMEAVKTIDGMVARVESLKRKLSDLQDSSSTPLDGVMRARIRHIHDVEALDSRDNPKYGEWSETRLNRWLVDWSLRNGRVETGKKIAEVNGIQPLADIELFSEIHRIEDALRRYSCSEALAWCNENKAALRKLKCTLEFDLRLQEYIELSRAGKDTDAITYSKKHLLPWQDTHLPQITQASALIAFPANTKCPPYKRLYDYKRWSTLIETFRLTAYTLNTLPPQPLLNLALSAGLPALKLPSCYDSSCKNADCPTCDSSGLGYLAKEVPWSHHFNSTIVCRISGSIMDADNPPMAFPNGYVYSQQALTEMAAKSGDNLVTCPRTGVQCQLSELRKVFVS